jgi:hypothetical protein
VILFQLDLRVRLRANWICARVIQIEFVWIRLRQILPRSQGSVAEVWRKSIFAVGAIKTNLGKV